MKVKNKNTGFTESVLAISFNKSSYLVTCKKTSDKGINCDNWFTDREFKENFEVLDNEDEETLLIGKSCMDL